jgi:flagellar biosynthesis/type III secretory pathway protein FliH
MNKHTPIEDVVKIIKKTNDNKTHTDIEGIVDTLLHIAHPNDLGAPTEQLETAIREALQSQADQYEREKIESYAQGWNEGQQALKEMTKHSVDLSE